MIDTHAHLDSCADPPEALLVRAREAGVDRVVTVGSGIESCRAALELAESEEGVWAALGIHPHQAGEAEAARLDELRALLDDEQAVAVGETGLDFYREYARHDRQRELFDRQLRIAQELDKPVVVHSRSAEEATADALARFEGTVILHCFSSPELLSVALERGYYVSFAGNVTYPRASELQAAARDVPDELLLVETDSPYLAPQVVRGRANEPANVVHTARRVAELRGIGYEVLERLVEDNARRVLGW